MLPPKKQRRQVDHCALPCIRGASANAHRARLARRTRRCPRAESIAGLAVVRRRPSRAKKMSSLPPHHALGHAGGAAGVEDVEVVGASAGAKSRARGRRRRARPRTRPRRGAAASVLGAVVECDEHVAAAAARARPSPTCGPNSRSKIERHEVGVVEQVARARLDDVAVVDVDRHRAGLVTAEHRLDPLGAVQRVDPDVVAGLDAAGDQVVGQPVGALVELGVGAALVAGDQRQPRREPRRRRLRTGRRG